MKSLLLLAVTITLLLYPALLSYSSVQDKTHSLVTDGYIRGTAKITCWEYDAGLNTHVKVEVANAYHLKGARLMSAFIVDLTKNGPNSYLQIGKPVVPVREHDYMAFSGSFDSKDFPIKEPEQEVQAAKGTVTIEPNSIQTFVNADKKEYNEGDSATIFLGFVDANENFVDPDSINAKFNGSPIGDLLERKKSGSYTYVTPPLQKGDNRITVIPAKAGFNTEAATITVATAGSVDLPSTADNDDPCPIGDVGRIVVVMGTSPPSDEDTLTEGGVDIIAASTSGTTEMGIL